MNRDKFTCKFCKDTETTLNVHHLAYTAQDVWDEPNENLITVCEHCHIELESAKIDKINIIKIYKSNNWRSGFRIMFIYIGSTIVLRIYDKNEQHVVGFNLEHELVHMSKLISLQKKYKPNPF